MNKNHNHDLWNSHWVPGDGCTDLDLLASKVTFPLGPRAFVGGGGSSGTPVPFGRRLTITREHRYRQMFNKLLK